MPQGILVFAEQVDGVFRKVAFEMVSEGRRLADALGEPLTAAVLGSDVTGLAEELKKYGKPFEMETFPKEWHIWTTPGFNNNWRLTVDFFQRHLAPAI